MLTLWVVNASSCDCCCTQWLCTSSYQTSRCPLCVPLTKSQA